MTLTAEKSRTGNVVSIIDIITIVIDTAISIDIGGVIIIVAGRPKPPPRPFNRIPRSKSFRT